MFAVQITLWTAGIVLLTLLLNAPLIRPCLSWLGLDHVPSTQANIRGKAIQALLAYAQRAIHDLQRDDHEMLRGRPPPPPDASQNFFRVLSKDLLSAHSSSAAFHSAMQHPRFSMDYF